MTVLDWLLDSDPAIRWQVLRDLVHAPAEVVAAERARVATEGWGARLLALQGEDGQWAGGACFPARSFNRRDENQGQPWTSTLPTLQLLHDFGVDPRADRVRRAVALVRDHCRWEHAGQPFFSGEVEPCINGRTVTLGTYFDQDVDGVVARLLGEQLEDGGWNCEAENGSVRSSFATTINVLEGLLAHERATGGSAESIAARRRGEEYLLERKLFRRKSTGEVVNPAWLQFSFPTRWHYDVLRALEYFRSVGDAPDPRMDEAIDLLRSKQQPDGTLAAGEHASRQGPLRARGRRRSAQPVEHAAGAACPQLVRAVRYLSHATRSGNPYSGSTLPVVPSTMTRIPVRRRDVASPQPTTAGIPYSRAMIEACAAALPTSVTTAAARVKSGVQAGAVSGATRISPGWSSSNSSGPRITRTVPAHAPRRRRHARHEGLVRWNGADELREAVPHRWIIGFTRPTSRGGTRRACSARSDRRAAHVDGRRQAAFRRAPRGPRRESGRRRRPAPR